MTFWNDKSLEPKRSFKFYVTFGSTAGKKLQRWMVKAIDLPKFEVGETPHSYLNYEYYYPGKVKWSELTVTLVDPMDPDAAEQFVKILKAGGYRPPQSNKQLDTVSKSAMVNALGAKFTINQIGADPANVALGENVGGTKAAGDSGTPGAQWQLHNPWIKNVNFGKHSYEDEGMIEISLTIRYDYAMFIKNGSNITKDG